jgi:hypothetical protein
MQKIFLLALWSQKIKHFMQPWSLDIVIDKIKQTADTDFER